MAVKRHARRAGRGKVVRRAYVGLVGLLASCPRRNASLEITLVLDDRPTVLVI